MGVPEPTSSVVLLVLVCSLVSTSSRPCTSRGEPACKRLLPTGCCLQHRWRTTNGYRKRRPCLLRQFGLLKQKLCRTSNNIVDLSMIVRLQIFILENKLSIHLDRN